MRDPEAVNEKFDLRPVFVSGMKTPRLGLKTRKGKKCKEKQKRDSRTRTDDLPK